MIIAIGGLHGSGKTTYAKILARQLGLQHVSAGELFRQIANKKGLTLDELGRVASKDPSIDLLIDRRTKRLARKGNVVVDGQLAAWMLRNKADLKIYLLTPDEERFSRLAKRDRVAKESARKETASREAVQQQRYLKHYGIDLVDLSPYDIVLDTSLGSIQEVAGILSETAKQALKRLNRSYSPNRL